MLRSDRLKFSSIKQSLKYYAVYCRDCLRFSYSTFKDVRTMALTVGFARSGSSLIGYLLTAHRNIIFADEPFFLRKYGTLPFLYDRANINRLFNFIVHADRKRERQADKTETKVYIRREVRKKRYIFIPNQWQGRYTSLKVIGIKDSDKNREVVSDEKVLGHLKKRLSKKGISLKFIFTVRNPYDLIVGLTRHQKVSDEIVNCAIESISHNCKMNKKILNQTDAKNVFIHRHEDMCENPRRQLVKLCDFLQVPTSSDYLDDCSGQVIKEPHRNRFEIDWSEEQKQKVASLIEKYDFLSGYSWDS